LQGLELLLVLVKLRVGVELDAHAAVRVAFGQRLEVLGGAALVRLGRRDVAELDDDGPGSVQRCAGEHKGGESKKKEPPRIAETCLDPALQRGDVEVWASGFSNT